MRLREVRAQQDRINRLVNLMCDIPEGLHMTFNYDDDSSTKLLSPAERKRRQLEDRKRLNQSALRDANLRTQHREPAPKAPARAKFVPPPGWEGEVVSLAEYRRRKQARA